MKKLRFLTQMFFFFQRTTGFIVFTPEISESEIRITRPISESEIDNHKSEFYLVFWKTGSRDLHWAPIFLNLKFLSQLISNGFARSSASGRIALQKQGRHQRSQSKGTGRRQLNTFGTLASSLPPSARNVATPPLNLQSSHPHPPPPPLNLQSITAAPPRPHP